MSKVRAVLILSALWGSVWFLLGLGLGLLLTPISASDIAPPPFLELPIVFAVWGAVSGGAFAIVLALIERRASLRDLSQLRVSTWGALGAITLPLLLTVYETGIRGSPLSSDDWAPLLIVTAVSAIIGAACAVATLALARKGVDLGGAHRAA